MAGSISNRDETKSGIWFQDLRIASNVPKALSGWITPDGISELLEKDITAANAELQNTPYDLLRDPDGLNLREYQIRAIEATEKSVIDGAPTVLLSMAMDLVIQQNCKERIAYYVLQTFKMAK